MGTQDRRHHVAVFDSSPSPRVAAALWLPAYEKAGYFQLIIEPKAGAETTITLPFAPWADFYSDGAKVVPLTARVRSEAGDRAWTLRVTIDIPWIPARQRRDARSAAYRSGA